MGQALSWAIALLHLCFLPWLLIFFTLHLFDFLSSQLFSGESLLHLLNLIQREIKLARLKDESLPHKIWLKQHFSIGVNDVTRVLERMPPVVGSVTATPQNATFCCRNSKSPSLKLQAILVATDCNPRGLTKHLPVLASSREVPVIFVKDKKGGSFKLGEIVNMKTAMAIGVKARGNSINKLIGDILGDNNDVGRLPMYYILLCDKTIRLPMSHGKVCVLTESLHRVIESFIVSYRNRTYRIIATEFAYWAPNIESMEVNSESNPLERKDAEGPSLDESLENEEHLDVDSCDSDSPKNVNNDSVSPSSRVLREEDVRGVESDLVDSFEEGEIRDDSVLYNDGCIKDCMEKNLEDDAGEILGVHSQGDCGNVTTDDNEDVTPVIAPEKDSIIAPPSTPPGNDLNIAAESGSSWIDYIGPLTSDEIDSDKRWSYRDPNGNIHGLFSLAQLRSWKDYFPSDLQIWSYYGNVKEAILLHNALSRQTKDAG
ncbi:5-oxoprolinase-like protein [Tanacetum coccineum]